MTKQSWNKYRNKITGEIVNAQIITIKKDNWNRHHITFYISSFRQIVFESFEDINHDWEKVRNDSMEQK